MPKTRWLEIITLRILALTKGPLRPGVSPMNLFGEYTASSGRQQIMLYNNTYSRCLTQPLINFRHKETTGLARSTDAQPGFITLSRHFLWPNSTSPDYETDTTCLCIPTHTRSNRILSTLLRLQAVLLRSLSTPSAPDLKKHVTHGSSRHRLHLHSLGAWIQTVPMIGAASDTARRLYKAVEVCSESLAIRAVRRTRGRIINFLTSSSQTTSP
jgi:hypothetical protein